MKPSYINIHHSAYIPNYILQNSQIDKIDLIESQKLINTHIINSAEKLLRHAKITNDIVNQPPNSINLVPSQNQSYTNGKILQKNGDPEISETLKNNSCIKSNNPEDEKKRSSRKTLAKDKINKEIPKIKANQKSENFQAHSTS